MRESLGDRECVSEDFPKKGCNHVGVCRVYLHLFFCLHWVLVAAHGTCSCIMQTLSFCMWDLVPDQG